ncbi:MAG: tetratricopeptide repeat protein [Anaerolineaceae bacterium]
MSFGKKEDHKEIWEPFSKIIPKVKDDFNTALHKDPTLSKVWLGAIACALLQNDWDEAISLCGESVPFVSDAALKADRAWYLCLALTFAGDTVTDEEKTASEDAKTTKSGLESMISSVPRLGEMVFEHLASEIQNMKEESIQEKQKKNDFLDILLKPALAQYDKHSPIFGDNRIWPLLYQKANLLFHLGRYNDELSVRQLIILSLYPGAWIDLSNCLGRLSRYPEALEAAEKAIGYGAASSEAWLEKGMHFEAMSRFEDALQAYTKAADPNPENYRYPSTLPLKKREAPYCLCKKVALLVRLERYLEGLNVLEHLFSLWPESLMMEQIDEIIGRIPPSDVNDLSEAWYLKARVFAVNGDRDNASFYLTKTIGINPRNRYLATKDKLLKDLLKN